jgi:hypothetical protein
MPQPRRYHALIATEERDPADVQAMHRKTRGVAKGVALGIIDL